MPQDLATLEMMDKEDIQANALTVGNYLKEKLTGLMDKRRVIGEVRGMGLMLGVELVKDCKTKEPATSETAEVMERTKNYGLLIGKGGLFGNTLRIKPRMCITKGGIFCARRWIKFLAKLRQNKVGLNAYDCHLKHE